LANNTPLKGREPVRVGLVLQTGQAFMRGITRGVYRYMRVNRHWRIQGEGQYPLLQWDQVADWRGDGLIGVVNNQQQLDLLLRSGVPIVSAGSRIMHPKMSTVACDSEAIGRLAAEHLMAGGLKNFLFMSELRWDNERLRFEAFRAAVTAVGHHCEVLQLKVNEYVASDASGHYNPDLGEIAAALQRADKPLGVCTPNSELARMVVEVATECGFEVPDDLSVIGVNDDPLICESTVPHLSAVIQPAEQIGYEAAALLDAAIATPDLPTTTMLLPPLGIAARQSTDLLAVDDDDVREAIKFIRDHAHHPIAVRDITAHVAVSRRTLETKFQATIGRTPAHELRRVRLELAKTRLVETNDPITKIVFAAGFNSRQVFSTLFRRATGVTPSQYRRRYQAEVFRKFNQSI
jgi:LacI family transcriptional regulator